MSILFLAGSTMLIGEIFKRWQLITRGYYRQNFGYYSPGIVSSLFSPSLSAMMEEASIHSFLPLLQASKGTEFLKAFYIHVG